MLLSNDFPMKGIKAGCCVTLVWKDCTSAFPVKGTAVWLPVAVNDPACGSSAFRTMEVAPYPANPLKKSRFSKYVNRIADHGLNIVRHGAEIDCQVLEEFALFDVGG